MIQPVYIVLPYIIFAAIFDKINRKIPNRLTLSALILICTFAVKPRYFQAAVILFIFFIFYNVGFFGGGDGKAMAVITLAIGFQSVVVVFLFAAIFAILFGIAKISKSGFKEVGIRIFNVLKMLLKTDFEGIKRELIVGFRIPFMPFVLAGFLFWQMLLKGGMLV